MPDGTRARQGNRTPSPLSVARGHATQSRIAKAFNTRIVQAMREAHRDGCRFDRETAAWLNTSGHRTFRGLPFTVGNLQRIRRQTRFGHAPRTDTHRSTRAPANAPAG